MGHGVLNVEAIAALLFLCLVFWRARGSEPRHEGRSHERAAMAILTLATISAFWRNLSAPLLHDSYGLVYTASQESFSDVLRLFYVHPSSGDFFFRPVSYLVYWLYFKAAHFDPWRWHALSLFVHVLNSLLVYVIARRLSLAWFSSFCAALLFALHGSRPEAVAWAAARVDLFATFFVLLTLLGIDLLLRTGRTQWYSGIVACAAAALLSKESAYCLPVVVWIFLYLRNGSLGLHRVLAVVAAVCAAVFCYRYWVVGGIGGYGAASGQPTILHFSLIRTLNALFFRQWGLLFFPIDWADELPFAMWLSMAAMVAALVWLIVRARVERARLAATLALVVAAALPVQHLLLIGADLNGSRVLYLPVLGLALAWGVLIQSLKGAKTQLVIAACLFFFQTTALLHNLSLWREAAQLSARSCGFIAGEIVGGGGPVAVLDLPFKWKGAYFLNNAFPACVLFNSGGALKGPPDIVTAATTNLRVYRWNDATARFERSR